MNWREARIIGFDVETTGPPPSGALDPVKGRIVQVAFTVYTPTTDAFGPEYERLCGPDGVEMPEDVSRINHVWPKDVTDKPSADDQLEEITAFLADFIAEDHVWLAYNHPFDVSFLYQAFKRRNLPFPIDPMRVLDPLAFGRSQWVYNRLKQLARNLDVPVGGIHEACKDVRLTIQAMLKLSDLLELPTDYDALLAEQEKCIEEWQEATGHFFRDKYEEVGISPGAGGPRPQSTPSAARSSAATMVAQFRRTP